MYEVRPAERNGTRTEQGFAPGQSEVQGDDEFLAAGRSAHTAGARTSTGAGHRVLKAPRWCGGSVLTIFMQCAAHARAGACRSTRGAEGACRRRPLFEARFAENGDTWSSTCTRADMTPPGGGRG